MGVLRHRRFRRQETIPNDDDAEAEEYEDEEGGDEDDDSSVTGIPSAGLPPTTTENQFDKAKAIGKDVIEKVPSKYFCFSLYYLYV